MKKSKDPFEAAFEEEEQQQQQEEDDESPPQSPLGLDDNETNMHSNANAIATDPSSSAAAASVPARTGNDRDDNDEDDEEDEDRMDDPELGRSRPSGDPAKMQEILRHFTEEQMSRYESFRRSGFHKSNMKRLVSSLIGSAKISVPMTIVVSGIAKMFVGEVVETARVVMAERRDTGQIRPCHVREAYRRLKLEGKSPKRSVPRLFR